MNIGTVAALALVVAQNYEEKDWTWKMSLDRWAPDQNGPALNGIFAIIYRCNWLSLSTTRMSS